MKHDNHIAWSCCGRKFKTFEAIKNHWAGHKKPARPVAYAALQIKVSAFYRVIIPKGT